MRRDALPLLGFAAALAALDALLWWYRPTQLAGWLLALPAVTAVLAAVGVAVPRAASRLRVVPELSLSTVVLAIACVAAASGVVFGLWLCLIGAGLAAAAVIGIVRELRSGPEQRP